VKTNLTPDTYEKKNFVPKSVTINIENEKDFQKSILENETYHGTNDSYEYHADFQNEHQILRQGEKIIIIGHDLINSYE